MNYNKIILGTVQFGIKYGINNVVEKPSKQEVFNIFEFAVKNNIQTLDTADGYGNACEIIGKFHKQTRFKFQINTKFKYNQSKSLNEQLHDSINKLNINYANIFAIKC